MLEFSLWLSFMLTGPRFATPAARAAFNAEFQRAIALEPWLRRPEFFGALSPWETKLLDDLGKDYFFTREQATETLRWLGGLAAKPLAWGAASPDPEIRHRAQAIWRDLLFPIVPPEPEPEPMGDEVPPCPPALLGAI